MVARASPNEITNAAAAAATKAQACGRRVLVLPTMIGLP